MRGPHRDNCSYIYIYIYIGNVYKIRDYFVKQLVSMKQLKCHYTDFKKGFMYFNLSLSLSLWHTHTHTHTYRHTHTHTHVRPYTPLPHIYTYIFSCNFSHFLMWKIAAKYIRINNRECYGCCRTKWIRQHEFKSWTKLLTFHIVLLYLIKA